MEHEDNAQFDNYLQSAQQQNLQLGNNTGNGDALVGLGLNVDTNVGCGGALGEVGKYDDVEDENEWKIIKEVNQSEKEQAGGNQQSLHFGNGKNHENVIDDADDDDDEDDEDDYENEGMPSMQYRNNGNDEHHNGATKDDFADVGDFSQTSNTASTAEGGCIDMLQVEMKIDPFKQEQLPLQQQSHPFDEEDPSSNGTSSLSENAPMPQQQQLTSTSPFDDFLQNKENADPEKSSNSPVPRPTELNFEVHASHLNPDAKEFVPSFGSNATSPTMSETADVEHVAEPVEQLHAPLSALPRHRLLSGDDDVLARSPRKGREIDMDVENLVLPDSELDFDNEAKKRPHEFEQDEDLIGDQLEMSKCSPLPDEPVDSTTNPNEDQVPVVQNNENDVMKQSIYMAENGDMQEEEAIENVLNSVQQLPTDIESLNSSFVEDVYAGTPEEARAMEDLLSQPIDADEEHTSHPPSIEEMQMNLQNVNNKDISLDEPMNLDMNSAAHMQESFYMENQATEEPMNEEQQHADDDGFYAKQFATNESLLMDTSIPYNQGIEQQHEEMFINNDDFSGNAKVLDYDDEQKIVTNMSSPSPKSTVEEKHLMEETKEQLVAKTIQDGQQFVEELGKKMENLLSSSIDCDLKQVC